MKKFENKKITRGGADLNKSSLFYGFRKKVVIISLLLFVVLGIIWFSYSYAIFKKEIEATNVDLRVGELSYNLECNKLENNRITITPNMSEVLDIKLTSLNEINSKYELYYKIISPEVLENEVEGGYLYGTEVTSSGVIEKNEEKNIQLVINNTGNQEIIIEIFIKAGLINNELVLEDSELSLKEELIQKFYVFDYTGDSQEFIVPVSGIYKLDVWGAQGGVPKISYGGYATGAYEVQKGEKLYVYVGEIGANRSSGAYNGGGLCYGYFDITTNAEFGFSGGGGATDIRTTKNENYEKRIIVAGAGGGGTDRGGLMTDYNYGYGGGGRAYAAKGIGSYYSGNNGVGGSCSVASGGCWGRKCDGSDYIAGCTGGGGGGYVAGRGIKSNISTPTPEWVAYYTCIAEGGTSYIDGVISTDEIPKEMIPGNMSMPTHDLTSTMTGNKGDGYARITYVNK